MGTELADGADLSVPELGYTALTDDAEGIGETRSTYSGDYQGDCPQSGPIAPGVTFWVDDQCLAV